MIRKSDYKKFLINYDIAKKYYEEHGDLIIPTSHKIGKWIKTLRYRYKRGELCDDYIEMLEKIGMVWDGVEGKWMKKYNALKKYYIQFGNIKISSFEDVIYEEVNLTNFIETQRQMYADGTLSKERIDLLEKLGMTWGYTENWKNNFEKIKEDDEPFDREKYMSLNWEYMYSIACSYYKEHGNLLVKQSNGELGYWIFRQRDLYVRGLLERDKIIKLNNIGMIWFLQDNEVNYNRSRKLLIETLKLIKEEYCKVDETGIDNNKKRVRNTINYK